MTTAALKTLLCIYLLLLPCLAEADSRERSFSIKDISTHEENDMSPIFSPDGMKLAYVRSSAGKTELWILDLENQRERLVKSFSIRQSRFGFGLSWAPDSRFFVFVGQGMKLYLGCTDMERTFLLTDSSEADGEPKWSPDGKYIAFVSGRTGNGDIYLISIKDLLEKLSDDFSLNLAARARNHIFHLTPGSEGLDYGPNWSPDSRAIVYHSYSRNPWHPGGSETFNVKIIAELDEVVEGSAQPKPKLLTDWADFNEMHPSWSPDGRWIAFYSDLIYPDNWSKSKTQDKQFRLYVIGIDSRRHLSIDVEPFLEVSDADGAILTGDVNVNVNVESGPSWLPDSRGVVYTRRDSMERDQIHWAPVSDKVPRHLDFSTWMNSDVTVCKDGTKIAFTAQEGARDCLHIAVINMDELR
jgi:Tol biopolymer transport system component